LFEAVRQEANHEHPCVEMLMLFCVCCVMAARSNLANGELHLNCQKNNVDITKHRHKTHNRLSLPSAVSWTVVFLCVHAVKRTSRQASKTGIQHLLSLAVFVCRHTHAHKLPSCRTTSENKLTVAIVHMQQLSVVSQPHDQHMCKVCCCQS